MGQRNERENGTNRIKAVSTTFKIIDVLSRTGSRSLASLVDELDMPKSTVHVYLKTLSEEGYVINDDGEYRLSQKFLEVGGAVRQRMQIYQTARPKIDQLSAETGEVANLGIVENGLRVLLYTSEPTEGMFDNSPTGQHTRMHWTALGKAMLAQFSDDRVARVVDRYGLPSATENTITEREALYDELERIRDLKYAVEDEERREGIKAIAVPLQHDSDEGPISAISISGPKRRIGGDDIDQDLVDALRDTVNVVNLKYKHY